jgi:hypothetical protein
MNREKVLGIVRHSLTFVGGLLVAKGIVTEALSQEIIGGLVSLVGLVWSVLSKKTTPTA